MNTILLLSFAVDGAFASMELDRRTSCAEPSLRILALLPFLVELIFNVECQIQSDIIRILNIKISFKLKKTAIEIALYIEDKKYIQLDWSKTVPFLQSNKIEDPKDLSPELSQNWQNNVVPVLEPSI